MQLRRKRIQKASKRVFRITRSVTRALEDALRRLTEAHRPTYVRISRTVEMVDQTADDWRNKNSQLIYMTALGLHPNTTWRGLIPFNLTLQNLVAPGPSTDKKKDSQDIPEK